MSLPANNQYQITGLTNGTLYTIVVVAQNYRGNSAPSGNIQATPYTTPSAPTIYAAVSGNQTLDISFSAPTNGGNTITAYYYSIDDGSTYTSMSLPVNNKYQITGLTNGTLYTIVVKAENYRGNSAPSGNLQATPYTRPDAPILYAAVAGNQTIDISFSTPDNGGATIIAYYYSTDNGVNFTSMSLPSNNRYQITGLTNGTLYTIVVIARTSRGDSLPSGNIQATPSTIPNAPTIYTAVSGNTTIDISFSAPNNGGNTITSYYYSIDDGLNYTSMSLPANNKYQITGLTNGTLYTIVVVAQNYRGNSAPSGNIQATPFTIPSSPTLYEAVSTSGGTIDISFSAPNNGGNTITAYYYSTNNGSSYTSMSLPLNNRYQITGLTNGTLYTIVVVAQNYRGNSAPSGNLQATPFSIPSSPTLYAAVSGNQTIDVSFSTPDNGGSAITSYEYSLNSTDFVNIGLPADNKYNISYGLTNGTTYSVSVRAVNVRGNSVSSNTIQTTPSTIPNAPVLYPVAIGNKLIDISFSTPYDGGNAISAYYYSVDGNTYSNIGLPTDNKYRITGLNNGNTYSVSVRAQNARGNSLVYNVIDAVPASAPDPPVVYAVSANQSVDVSFTTPYNGGNAIVRYEYTINTTDTNNFRSTAPVLPVDNKFTILQLTNGTTYYIRMTAVNVVGSSDPSELVVATPFTYPDKPTIDAATPLDGGVRIQITPPTNTGGNTISGYKYAVVLGGI
jgi:titin